MLSLRPNWPGHPYIGRNKKKYIAKYACCLTVCTLKTNTCQVGDTLVETAQFEVPGFASGCYMVAARGGRVLWEQAASWGIDRNYLFFEIKRNYEHIFMQLYLCRDGLIFVWLSFSYLYWGCFPYASKYTFNPTGEKMNMHKRKATLMEDDPKNLKCHCYATLSLSPLLNSAACITYSVWS